MQSHCKTHPRSALYRPCKTKTSPLADNRVTLCAERKNAEERYFRKTLRKIMLWSIIILLRFHDVFYPFSARPSVQVNIVYYGTFVCVNTSLLYSVDEYRIIVLKQSIVCKSNVPRAAVQRGHTHPSRFPFLKTMRLLYEGKYIYIPDRQENTRLIIVLLRSSWELPCIGKSRRIEFLYIYI